MHAILMGGRSVMALLATLVNHPGGQYSTSHATVSGWLRAGCLGLAMGRLDDVLLENNDGNETSTMVC